MICRKVNRRHQVDDSCSWKQIALSTNTEFPIVLVFFISKYIKLMIYYHHQAQSKISTDRETTVQSGGQLAYLGTKHHPTTCQAPMDVKSVLLNRAKLTVTMMHKGTLCSKFTVTKL